MKKLYKTPELDIIDMRFNDVIAVSQTVDGYNDGVEKDIFDDGVASDQNVANGK